MAEREVALFLSGFLDGVMKGRQRREDNRIRQEQHKSTLASQQQDRERNDFLVEGERQRRLNEAEDRARDQKLRDATGGIEAQADRARERSDLEIKGLRQTLENQKRTGTLTDLKLKELERKLGDLQGVSREAARDELLTIATKDEFDKMDRTMRETAITLVQDGANPGVALDEAEKRFFLERVILPLTSARLAAKIVDGAGVNFASDIDDKGRNVASGQWMPAERVQALIPGADFAPGSFITTEEFVDAVGEARDINTGQEGTLEDWTANVLLQIAKEQFPSGSQPEGILKAGIRREFGDAGVETASRFKTALRQTFATGSNPALLPKVIGKRFSGSVGPQVGPNSAVAGATTLPSGKSISEAMSQIPTERLGDEPSTIAKSLAIAGIIESRDVQAMTQALIQQNQVPAVR